MSIRNHKGFTLIEILIVIIIIGIIMSTTLSFGGDKISALRTKTAQEHYLDYLNGIQSKMLLSNYDNNQKFTSYMLTLKKEEPIHAEIKYDLSNEKKDPKEKQEANIKNSADIFVNNTTIEKIILGQKEQETLEIQFIPYQLGAKVHEISTAIDTLIYFSAKNRNEKTCYQFTPQIGKFKRVEDSRCG